MGGCQQFVVLTFDISFIDTFLHQTACMLVDYPSEDEAERCGSDADAEAEPVRPKRAASPSLPPAKR